MAHSISLLTLVRTCTAYSARAASTLAFVTLLALAVSSIATAAITPSLVAARTSGVAPLAVFFDASATTDTALTTRPFHDLEYTWNFGDGTSGTWAHGAQPGVNSRNAAKGPVAAHVFESPGIYTVSLSVYNGTSTVTTTTTITVTDPNTVFSGASTICVAANSVPVAGSGGCPAGAAVARQPSFPAAIEAYATTGRRVLFKRGDTFAAATEAVIRATGPGTVGSYGTGALPVVQMTGNTNTLGFSSVYTPAFSDWRVMDLELDGMGGNATSGTGIGETSGGITQVTVLRLIYRNMSNAIGFSVDRINYTNNYAASVNRPDLGGHVVDQVAVVDSVVIAGLNTIYSAYDSGYRISFLGNNFDNGGNPGGSHVTRWSYLNRAVISNNSFSRPGFTRLTIKLHGPGWNAVNNDGIFDPTATHPRNDPDSWSNYSPAASGDGYSKHIVISDNKLTEAANPWSVTIGPEDPYNDERVHDVIVERNWFVANSASQVSLRISEPEVTVRNNIHDFSNGSNGQNAVMIVKDGITPAPSSIRVYNNTYYTSYAVPDGQFVGIQVDGPATNVAVKNNLAYAPNAANPVMLVNSCGACVTASNNAADSQVKNLNPFIATSPSAVADFRLGATSYAKGSGTAVPGLLSDFLGVRRGAVMDLGALDAQGHGSPSIQSTHKVSEGAAFARLRVDRAGGTQGAIGVGYATSNGTALAGSDYTAGSGTLSWADGDGSAKFIEVPMVHDAVTEASKNFSVTLSNVTGLASLGNAVATVTIADDDPATPFGDVGGSGFLGYINAIYGAGITVGCGNGHYCPAQSVTRGQMAAFLIRGVEGEPMAGYCGATTPYSDVAVSNGFCGYIKRLKELNITTGCGGGNYCPNNNVTRQEIAAFIVRAVEGEPASTYCASGSGFSDVSPANTFCRHIKRLAELGITTGCGGGNYCPNGIVSRDQMAAFIARAFLGM